MSGSESDSEIERVSGEIPEEGVECSSSESTGEDTSGSDSEVGEETPIDIETVSPNKPNQASTSRTQSTSRTRTGSNRTALHYSEIVSTITPQEAIEIKKKYHIPREYTVRAPLENERMHEPPQGSIAIPVSSLHCGFRIPIPHEVVEILNRARLCPTQLVPNSFSLLLSFIIFVRSMGHLPTYANFCDLFTCQTSSKSGSSTDSGFYYFSSRQGLKIIKPPTSSYGKLWKHRWVFISPPAGREFGTRRRWAEGKIVLDSGADRPTWSINFLQTMKKEAPQSSSYLCSEHILAAANLSPAPVTEEITFGRFPLGV